MNKKLRSKLPGFRPTISYKKGADIMFTAIGVAILVLITVGVLIYAGVLKIPKIAGQAEEVAGGVYACSCSHPGVQGVCALTQPVGYTSTNPPAQCNGKWDDCTQTCWRLTVA